MMELKGGEGWGGRGTGSLGQSDDLPMFLRRWVAEPVGGFEELSQAASSPTGGFGRRWWYLTGLSRVNVPG
jgi:hypothetical protein